MGLLGGSFNPAHEGHRRLAAHALRRLRLHQVWLLVSPGNPLKPADGMAPAAERLRSARAVADGRRVVATEIERYLHTRFTADTLCALRRRFPRVRFVWLMGADNLRQLPRWQRWMQIARTMPMAVHPRPSYNERALAGQAAQRLRHARRPARVASVLADAVPAAWVFLAEQQSALSATELRRRGSASHARPHRIPAKHAIQGVETSPTGARP